LSGGAGVYPMTHHPRRIPLIFIGRATAVAFVLLITGCVHTASFKDANGQIIPGSIAAMETAAIGGISQSIWFRGISRSSPALILLHGGPGASELALFRHYNSALEQHFLVVYWEQRGTGRSFHSDIPPKSMAVARFVRDLDEVVELVRRRFDKDKDKDKVVLLAHSWGTVLGTIYAARYPEKVAAYVGIAQIADVPEGRRLSYEFAISEAVKHGNSSAVSELEAIGPPPYASVDEMLTTGKWVERFGGMFHAGLSTGKLIRAALSTDEANLADLVKFGQGNRFSLVQLEDEISQLHLSGQYRSFKVPVFFLLGRYDRHVPAVLAEQYLGKIEAPYKRLIWFEQSAHNPPLRGAGEIRQGIDRTSLAFITPVKSSCCSSRYIS
jgi:pimeloyl-ACP methyl ester carboxylesterase